jgi:hypothetical protein
MCGARLPAWNEGRISRWLRSGALEVAVFAVVAAVFVATWLLVLSHR